MLRKAMKPKAGSAKLETDEGDIAPDFSLPDQTGKTIKLSDVLSEGRKVVLFFYVRDDTPGCTREACAFRDGIGELAAAGAKVLGISPDDSASHSKFATKYKLSYPLLADVGAKAAKAYGVYKLKNMYGRRYFGVERSTFIIGPDGKILNSFRRVKVDGHTRQVLEALQ